MTTFTNQLHRFAFAAVVTLLAAASPVAISAQPSPHAGHAHHGPDVAEQTAEAPVVRMENGVHVVDIKVTAKGFAPSRIELKAGVPARLVFTRTEKAGCADKVQIPAFGVKNTDLPLNKAVAVEFTPAKGGDYTFACSMNMVKGAILVKS